jgi:serine/threonine-protein kinase
MLSKMSGSPESPEDEDKKSPGLTPAAPSKKRDEQRSGISPRPPAEAIAKPPSPAKPKPPKPAGAKGERTAQSESGVAAVKKAIVPPKTKLPQKLPGAPKLPEGAEKKKDASGLGSISSPFEDESIDPEDSSTTMRPPDASDDLSNPSEPLPVDESLDISLDSLRPSALEEEEEEGDPYLTSLPPSAVSFGRYNLLGRLAVGGMAEIFLANERTEGGASRHVVVKMARPHLTELTGFDDMFTNEGRVAMRLTHPNICHVYEFGKERGRYFMAMEWVNGVSLRDLTRRAKQRGEQLPVDVVVKIIAQMADALDYAHRLRDSRGRSLNIVHRDVSPHNIMISYDGVVKLLDFGVAKGGHTKETTQSGTVKGKFNYMSPQQCTGRSIDGRADVFSLGVCLWEALTAKALFKRETQYETFKAIIEDEVPKISEFRDDVPEELDELLSKALAKSLTDRYKTAGEFHDDLARFLQKRGDVVSSSKISRYMEGLFEDELAAGPHLETSEEIFARIAPAESLKASSKPATQEQNKWLVPMVAGVLGVLAGVVLIVTLAADSDDDDNRPSVEDPQVVVPPETAPAQPPPETTMAQVVEEAPVMVVTMDTAAEEVATDMAEEEEVEETSEGETEEESEESEESEGSTMRRRRRRGMRSTMGGFVTDPGF